ncbi:MAG: hypothetical protein L0K86_03320 [Actinomycetia bacterium]|nr:hypothetical protein [Actinomycetes bacterium]
MPPDEAEPRRPRPRRRENIRYYVDEDILGLGYAMMWARTDTVTCGETLVEDDLPRQIPDPAWIPFVATHGWVAITSNRKIRTNPIEGAAARTSGARIVCVHDERGDLNTWQKLGLLVLHWDKPERFVEEHAGGPWWLSVTRSGVRELDYGKH